MVVLAGLTPVAAKDAIGEMPPLTTGVLRFTLAGLLLALTARLAGGAPPLARRDLPRFVVAALLCVPINQSSYLMGVKLSGAAHAGLFYALNPVLTFGLTVALGQAAFSRRMAAATGLAFCGAAVVGLDGLLGGGMTSLLGDGLLLIAVVSWAAFTIVVLPLGRRYGLLGTLWIVMLLGAALYSPALFIDGAQLDPWRLSGRALGGFAFIAILTSYVNYIVWFAAARRLDLTRVSVVGNAAPILAVVAAHLWCDEPITPWLALGAILIIAAITLSNWPAAASHRVRASAVSRD